MNQKPNNNLLGKRSIPTQAIIQKKRKILVWSDCVLATTGFGVVSKYILRALHESGLYEIDQLAINYFGDFYNKNEVPYCISPAKLKDPSDPYGKATFLENVEKNDYDFIFIINDTFVADLIADGLQDIKVRKLSENKKVFKLIYYFPVDCRVLSGVTKLIKMADRAVVYTNFGKQECEKVGVHPTDVIYHGTDVDSFYPITQIERHRAREQFFKIKDPQKFVIINVNRNTKRKDVPKTIYAFSEFRKLVPNSTLYLHMSLRDSNWNSEVIDLLSCMDHLGLKPGTDIMFPQNFNTVSGFPVQVLNQLYNCGDLYLSTHLGEGWGLCPAEAMAAGVPVVVPDNTVTPEIFGNSERGYVYPCKDLTFIDNSGYRAIGHTEDIVQVMYKAWSDWKSKSPDRDKKIVQAREFTNQYSWKNVTKRWVSLFNETYITNACDLKKSSCEVL